MLRALATFMLACLLWTPAAAQNRVTVNFDSVAAYSDPVAYFQNLGIALQRTAGSVQLWDYLPSDLGVASRPNFLYLNGTASLGFATAVSNVGFVRLAKSVRVSWTASAYDSNGNLLATAGEDGSQSQSANATFTLSARGIASVRFSTALSGLYIDDLTYETASGATTTTGTGCGGTGVSADQMFAFAEATFPWLFGGPPVPGVTGPYTYRFYLFTGHYLGIDTNCTIYVYGPTTGYRLVTVGPLSSFAATILAWQSGGGTVTGTGGTTTGGTTTGGTTTGGTTTGGTTTGGATTGGTTTTAAPPCTYSVSPTTVSIGADADAASIGASVSVRQNESRCTVPNPPWTVSSQSGWLVVTVGALSNGQGPAYIRADPNTTAAARVGGVTVAGVGITVNQPAGVNPLAGSYRGSWSGSCPVYGNVTVSGTWSMTVDSRGNIMGSFSGSESGIINGTVDSSGRLGSATGAAGVSSWQGSLAAANRGGTWSTGDCNGSWR